MSPEVPVSQIAHEPDPVLADIVFEFDLKGQCGQFFVDNILEAEVEPICNPVTGEERLQTRLLE